MNKETLLNIARASMLEPLSFVAITQVQGSQTETLTTGLPAISFGPGQTAANHVYQISNSLASAVNGSYQSAPLVSTAFQTGMLSPVDPRTVANLILAHPREPVLYALIESISIKQKSGPVYRFRNDPLQDEASLDCRDLLTRTPAENLIRYVNNCNYSLFINYLGVLNAGGLTSELLPTKSASNSEGQKKPASGAPAAAPPGAAPAPAKPSVGTPSTGTTTIVGHLCFDPTRSIEGIKAPTCGTLKSLDPAKNDPVSFSIPGFGTVEITISMRSPLAVYQYLGKFLRSKQKPWTGYVSDDARSLLATGEPFLNIISVPAEKCFTSVSYGEGFYCVPVSSLHTKMLLNILQELKNMNISPNDLNSALSVRVIGN
jgi:hypothetical protein